jgi:23S rRNA (pseudouridine1915-N3)-methyltransferase
LTQIDEDLEMKLVLLNISSKREVWLEEAKEIYQEKIARMIGFQIDELRSVKIERDDATKKKKLESQNICAFLKSDDYVILFDEKGQTMNSLQFAKFLEQQLGSAKKRMVFIVGGAFGVDETVKTKAQKIIAISSFTLNHRVAFLLALEQIYRAFTIMKRMPYHNE